LFIYEQWLEAGDGNRDRDTGHLYAIEDSGDRFLAFIGRCRDYELNEEAATESEWLTALMV
jgi:hypothetical protein